MLFVLVLCFVGINLFLAYLYRQGVISDKMLIIITGLTAGTSVYVGLVVLGVAYDNWGPISIFVVAGLLLGIQGAGVAIRIRKAERASSQSSKDDSE